MPEAEGFSSLPFFYIYYNTALSIIDICKKLIPNLNI